MKLTATFGAILLAAFLAVACDDGGVIALDPGADDATATDEAIAGDAEVEAFEATPEPGPLDTVPTDKVEQVPYIPDSSFRFEMSGRDGDTILVDVIARQVPPVFGIALRVEWDPEAADMLDPSMEPLFGDEPAAIYRSAPVRPGSLTIGMAYLGRKKGTERPLDGDVKVATLRLRPKTGKPFILSFFGPRCLLVNRNLEKVGATWLSSTVYP
jgi:hypothetical protein